MARSDDFVPVDGARRLWQRCGRGVCARFRRLCVVGFGRGDSHCGGLGDEGAGAGARSLRKGFWAEDRDGLRRIVRDFADARIERGVVRCGMAGVVDLARSGRYAPPVEARGDDVDYAGDFRHSADARRGTGFCRQGRCLSG